MRTLVRAPLPDSAHMLASLADSGFVLRVSQKVKEPGQKRPVMTETDIDIPFDSVKKANVLLEF